MKLSPQTKIVLKHLMAKGSITAVEAAAVHRIRSLSRRVSELISDANGYMIAKEYHKDVTGQRYVRYVLDAGHRTCKCDACKEARA